MLLLTLRPDGREAATAHWQRLGVGILGCCLALAVITLPAGYGENLLRFGNPLGPKSVREEHTIEGRGHTAFLRNGGLNLLRYSYDFASLDCLLDTPLTRRIQHGMFQGPLWALQRLGIDLRAGRDARRQFMYNRLYSADENCSYFGVFGVLLLLPGVLLTLFGCNKSPGMRLFALATVVYVLVQAFASPYDPWRGRYFMTSALFAAPTLGLMAFPRRPLGKLYLALVVALGCVLSIFAAFERHGTLVFPVRVAGQTIP